MAVVLEHFCCPLCKGSLAATPEELFCARCKIHFPWIDGIPDFFISNSEQEAIDEPNKTWLDPSVVEARDTIYRLCSRQLKGMAFCMEEIRRRTYAGCRILEVGVGTGHFTRWLVEVTSPGTVIYTFDFSWPILKKAQENTQGLPSITLFRANARAPLPFKDESFDILFLRLAPLGPHGVPNVQAGLKLLKPGGWYFEAGWEKENFSAWPTEWAIKHGYENAEFHLWQYPRWQTETEYAAAKFERERLACLGCKSLEDQELETAEACNNREGGGVQKMTFEFLLIAQKPSDII